MKRNWRRTLAGILIPIVVATSLPLDGVYAKSNDMTSFESLQTLRDLSDALSDDLQGIIEESQRETSDEIDIDWNVEDSAELGEDIVNPEDGEAYEEMDCEAIVDSDELQEVEESDDNLEDYVVVVDDFENEDDSTVNNSNGVTEEVSADATEETAFEEDASLVEMEDTEDVGESEIYGDFTYEINEDGNAVILSYTGEDAVVEIPEKIGNAKVTELAMRAFNDNDTITSVTLPEGLEIIGHYAFYSCDKLETINFPDSLTTIGESAFRSAKALKSAELGDNVENIGATAFYQCFALTSVRIPAAIANQEEVRYPFQDCNALTNVTFGDGITRIPACFFAFSGLTAIEIPETVTEIGKNAFRSCEKLETMNIPGKLTSIGESAFYFCKAWTGEIVIPDTVTTIGAYAFQYCNEITKVTLGKNVETIGEDAFFSCKKLAEVNIPKALKITKSVRGIFTSCEALNTVTFEDGITEIQDCLFRTCTGLKEITIPESVTRIGNDAFRNSGLTSIDIPDSVISIGNSAFNNCDSLVTAHIGKNVTEIGDSTFALCNKLEEVNIPSGYSDDKNTAGIFSGCKALKKVTFDEGRTEIPAHLFRDCSGLEEVIIPDTVTKIGEAAFRNSGLTSIDIPESVTSIGGYAFYYCDSLLSAHIGKNVTEIGDMAFAYCTMLEEVNIPSGYSNEKSMYGIFSFCKALKKVTFDEGRTEIPAYLFKDCSGLEEITIPDTVTKIGESAFRDSGLTSIDIPESVTSIGGYAFYYCDSLLSAHIGKNVTEIGDMAFEYCTMLEEVNIPSGYSNEKSMFGIFSFCKALKKVTFDEGRTEIPAYLFRDCSGLEEITIPDTVTKIGENAFRNSGLIKINIPEGVISIGRYAFYNCTSLKEIDIPDSVTTIGDSAFSNCRGLLTVHLGKNLEILNAYVFSDCVSLNTINIPLKCTQNENITAGIQPFSGCKSLENVTFEEGVTEIPPAFFRNTGLKTFAVPESVTKIGKYAFYNCTSLEAIALPEGLTTIEDSAFYYCTSLKGVKIPSTCTNLGESIFYDCKNLVSVDLPNTLKIIPYFTFHGCTELKTINLPEGIETVDRYAFNNCTNLREATIPSTVTKFGYGVFSSCPSMENVYFWARETVFMGDIFLDKDLDAMVHCFEDSDCAIFAINNEYRAELYASSTSENAVIDSDSYLDFDMINAQAKGYFEVAVAYKYKEVVSDNVTKTALRVRVPGDFVAKSVKLDGASIENYTFNKSILTIPCSQREGKITFLVKTDANLEKLYYSYALFDYEKDGKKAYDIVGTRQEVLPAISVEADQNQTSNPFQLKGMAPSASEVTIYVDGKELTKVTALKSGKWTAEVMLPKEDLIEFAPYKIKVSANSREGINYTAETTCWYMPNKANLTGFDMYYNAHQDKHLDLTNPKVDGSSVTFNPHYNFTFAVEFDDPNKVDNVKVVAHKGNDYDYIPAVYDESSGKFIAEGKFEKFGNVPGAITLSYEDKGDKGDKDSFNFQHPAIQKAATQVANNYTVDRTYIKTSSNVSFTSYTYTPKETEGDSAVSDVIDFAFSELGDISDLDELKDTTFGKVGGGLCSLYDLYSLQKYIAGDKFWLTTVADVILDPNKENASGLLCMVGDLSNNSIFVLFLEDATGLSDLAGPLGVFGDICSTAGNIVGNHANYDKVKEQILSQYSGAEADAKLAELTACVALNDIWDLCVGGLSVAAFFFPELAVPALIVGTLGFFADKFFDSWYEHMMNGEWGFKWLIDPSGYVYAGVSSNRVKGVKATVYYKDSSGKAVAWDAEEYQQINPQFTDEEGAYAWDVLEGEWKVVLEAEGYERAETEWLPVPPIQTDVNIGLIANTNPVVKKVSTYLNKTVVKFDQYMDIATANSIKLYDADGKEIAARVSCVSENGVDGKALANEFICTYVSSVKEGDEVTVAVAEGVTAYTGKKIAKEYKATNKASKPGQISANSVRIESNDTYVISGNIIGYATGDKIVASSSNAGAVAITEITQPDKNGDFKIKVKGNFKGSAVLGIAIEDTDVQKEIVVAVGEDVDESILAKQIQLSDTALLIEIGESKEVTAVCSPSYVTGKWTIVSGADCITLSGNKVTANKAGNAVIRFTCDQDAKVYQECVVTVYNGELPLHQITVTYGEGGEVYQKTVSGDVLVGAKAEVNVTEGSDAVFTMKAKDGYEVAKVLIDGKDAELSGTVTFASVSENHTLDVQFAKNSYGVTLFAGNGYMETSNKRFIVSDNGTKVMFQQKIGEAYGELPVPSLQGLLFTGWYTESKGGQLITSETKFDGKSDIKLYAHWDFITLVEKQKIDMSPFFMMELEAYLGDSPKGKQYKYVVTKAESYKDAFGNVTTFTDNKGAASMAKSGVVTAKKAGVVEVRLSTKNLETKTWEMSDRVLVLAIEKPVTKNATLTYAGQKIALEDMLSYLGQEMVGSQPNACEIKITSTKPEVADYANGIMEAKATGKTKLVVEYTCDYGGKKPMVMKKSITVTVKIPKFAKEEITIAAGKKGKVALKNTDKSETISYSSKAAFVTVDEKGSVSVSADAVSGDKADIIATVVSSDGTKTEYSYKVVVR